jgi:protein-tyrosine phosphatase
MASRAAFDEEMEHRQRAVALAGEELRAGGLVIFPTETVYGVGASTASEAGLQALRRFKDRNDGRPFTVHVPDTQRLARYIDLSPGLVTRLVRKTLPGPVTLVVEQSPAVIDAKVRDLLREGFFGAMDWRSDEAVAAVRDRLYFENAIGLRVPDHPLAAQVLAAVEAPVVASSVNRRGEEPAVDHARCVEVAGGEVRAIVDGGRCRFARSSTIVRVTLKGGEARMSVEREGVIDSRFLDKLRVEVVLVVCSGNTCRSPMGAALARQLLAEQRGLSPSELDAAGVRVLSAGTSAMEGAPATPEAVETMRRRGLDLSGHRSTPLTPAMLHEADAVFCMTASHRSAVIAMAPNVAGRVHAADPEADVQDPFGGDASDYERCAAQLRKGLERQLKEAMR